MMKLQKKSKNGNQQTGEDEDRKMRKLFVDKLNASITEEDIFAVFSKHGEIEEVAKYQDRRAPKRYFAFVVYKHAKDCVKATYDPCPVIKGLKCACMLAAIGKQFSGYKFFVQKGLLTEDQKNEKAMLEHSKSAQPTMSHGHSNNKNKTGNKSHNNNGKKPRQRRGKNKNKGGNNHNHHGNNTKDNHNQQRPQLSKIDINIHAQHPQFHDDNQHSSRSAIMNNTSHFEESPIHSADAHPQLQSYFDSMSHSTVASLDNNHRHNHPNHPEQGLPAFRPQSQSYNVGMQRQQQFNNNHQQYNHPQRQQQQHQQQQQGTPRYNTNNSYTHHTRRDYVSQSHPALYPSPSAHNAGRNYPNGYDQQRPSTSSFSRSCTPYMRQQQHSNSRSPPYMSQYHSSHGSYSQFSNFSNVPSMNLNNHSSNNYYPAGQQKQGNHGQPQHQQPTSYHRRSRTQSHSYYNQQQPTQQQPQYTHHSNQYQPQQTAPQQQQQVPRHQVSYSQMPPSRQPQVVQARPVHNNNNGHPQQQQQQYSLSPQPTKPQQPVGIMSQPPPMPQMTHSQSYGGAGCVERSRSFSSQSQQSAHTPTLKNPLELQQPKLSASTSAVNLMPKTTMNQPAMLRSHSARSGAMRHAAVNYMNMKPPPINDNIPSPDLLADNFMEMDLEIGLTPSPPPVQPLPLCAGAKPSIDLENINEQKLDLIPTPIPKFKNVQDAIKASDKELEAGFTMLASPTPSAECEQDEDSEEMPHLELQSRSSHGNPEQTADSK